MLFSSYFIARAGPHQIVLNRNRSDESGRLWLVPVLEGKVCIISLLIDISHTRFVEAKPAL